MGRNRHVALVGLEGLATSGVYALCQVIDSFPCQPSLDREWSHFVVWGLIKIRYWVCPRQISENKCTPHETSLIVYIQPWKPNKVDSWHLGERYDYSVYLVYLA